MRRTIGMLGGLALGACLSQFPEYAQQYTQRLGGAVDELRSMTIEFDADALRAGLTREQALVRYQQNSDSFIAARGATMARTFLRYEQLSASLAEIRGASGWERFQRLPEYFDTEIGQRALEDYKPAIPVTVEGIAYAGAGFGLGYVALSALAGVLLMPFRRRRRREPEYR